ncbi:MAG: AraC family transcriptional regulator [Bacteroidota bacterium]
MQPTVIYSWSAVIFWIGIYTSLILIPYLLLRTSGNRLGNTLMAGFVVMMGLRLFTAMNEFSEVDKMISYSTELSGILTFLYGPFFYFYLKGFIERKFTFQLKHLWHLVPVGVMLSAWLMVLIFAPSPHQKLIEMIRNGQQPPLGIRLVGMTLGLIFLAYLGMGITLILRFRQYVRTHASFSNAPYFRWLLFLAAILLLPVLSALLTVIVVNPTDFVPYPTYGISLMLSTILLIALIRPRILDGLPDSLMVDEVEELTPKRYESSSLAEDQKSVYLAGLLKHMDQQQPYLNQELTLNELANQLNMNAKYLSQIINEKQDQNFMDFINGYRIKQSQYLLTNSAYQYFTILAIAQESGFRSKSAFYNAFKKVTGMTPTTYKQQQAPNIS